VLGMVTLVRVSYVLMALPLTENLYCARCWAVRFSGGDLGAVRGLSIVESSISGSCRLTRELRSGPLSDIFGWEKV